MMLKETKGADTEKVRKRMADTLRMPMNRGMKEREERIY
jgi:hypothetical protein